MWITIAFVLMALTVGVTAMEIYLCIGQSNMLGRAVVEPQDSAVVAGVMLFNRKNEWEPAKPSMSRYTTIAGGGGGLGPSCYFAKTITRNKSEKTIGLVVNPKPTTSLMRNWIHRRADSGTNTLYDSSLARVKRALATNPNHRLAGIIWHQGESDIGRPEMYMDTLEKFIANWREDLGIPDLPFIAGELGPWTDRAITFNRHLQTLPERVPFTAVASAQGTSYLSPDGADAVHFDSRSMRIIGNSYGEKMLVLSSGSLVVHAFYTCRPKNPSTCPYFLSSNFQALGRTMYDLRGRFFADKSHPHGRLLPVIRLTNYNMQ